MLSMTSLLLIDNLTGEAKGTYGRLIVEHAHPAPPPDGSLVHTEHHP